MTTHVRWALYALTLLIIAVAFAFDPELGIITAGMAILLFAFLSLVIAGMRIWRGEVRLRPVNALKMALPLFLLGFCGRYLADLIFPSLESGLGYNLFQATAFAIFFSLYTTAYRKPA